ncbi:hypothetical protein X975_01498, partial [Stegodyphus mimosarum]
MISPSNKPSFSMGLCLLTGFAHNVDTRLKIMKICMLTADGHLCVYPFLKFFQFYKEFYLQMEYGKATLCESMLIL